MIARTGGRTDLRLDICTGLRENGGTATPGVIVVGESVSTTRRPDGASPGAGLHRTPSGKLQPPALPSVQVRRPRLESRLDAAATRRLTTVVAGAGFGKSTLVAGWARERECAWYTLGASDAGLTTFARGLVDAFRQRLPDLPELATDLDRSPAAAQDEEARAESLAALLCDWLDQRLGDSLVLVLDDVQELGRGTASARLLETLCRRGRPTPSPLFLKSRAAVPGGAPAWPRRGVVDRRSDAGLLGGRSRRAVRLRARLRPARSVDSRAHGRLAGCGTTRRRGAARDGSREA